MVTPTEMIDLLAKAIQAHEGVNALAADVVEALGAPDFTEAVKLEGGAVAAIQKRVGDAWAQDASNVAYIQALFTRIGEIGPAAGVDIRVLFPG